MGTQIVAKKAGTCPQCNNPWKQSDTIYWDGAHKNSAGFSVTCTDKKCFESQGGVITPPRTGSFPRRNQGYTPRTSYREHEDVTATLPEDYGSNPDLDKAADTVMRAIVKADEIAGNMYPNLKHNTNTYGQIRSKLVDQLLAVLTHQ